MKLEWSAGGWFGGQLGGSAWLLLAAGMTVARDLPTGLGLFGMFVVTNAAGYLLWRRRSLSCYASTQVLVAVMGVVGLLGIYWLDRRGLWREVQTEPSVSAATSYVVVAAVFVFLMILFHLRFGRRPNADAS